MFATSDQNVQVNTKRKLSSELKME